MQGKQYLSKKQRKILNAVVADLAAISSEVYHQSIEEWAKKAEVHQNTIRRLLDRKTSFPRFETIRRIAEAVGVEIVFNDLNSPTIKLPEWKNRKRRAA